MDCCCISVHTKTPAFVLLFLVTKTIFTQYLCVLAYCMGLSLLFAQGKKTQTSRHSCALRSRLTYMVFILHVNQ